MKTWISWAAVAVAAGLAPTPAAGQPEEGRPGVAAPAPGTCLTAPEVELARLVNQYREGRGRRALPVSRSLSLVARWHAIDLSENGGTRGTDPRGLPCGLQSWSDRGPWTRLCYTADHHYAEEMWRKPRELTANAYLGNGFELVYRTSGPLVLPRVVARWTDGAAQRDMILAEGVWRERDWPVMGVGVVGPYAVLWFGDQPDRQGELLPCPSVASASRP